MRANLLLPVQQGFLLDGSELEPACVITLDVTGTLDGAEQRRQQASAILRQARLEPNRLRVFVQIHELAAGLADADLDAVLGAAPDGIVLPGCRSGEDVQQLGAKLAVREAELGIADGSTCIIAVAAGDAAALFRMDTYTDSSRRLVGLGWDAQRLAAAFGVETGDSTGQPPAPLEWGRTLTLAAARAARVPAIDTACALAGDTLEAACWSARRDGFAGKFATHASQLPTIVAAFGAAAPLRPRSSGDQPGIR